MWRLFRWLDRHPPSFYKFTLMIFGLGMTVMTGFALVRLHPAVGIIFIYVAIFAFLRASHVYRFDIRPRLEAEEGKPAKPPDDPEKAARRTRRRARTEFWRRQTYAAKDEPGKRGDLARSIIKRWEEAEAAKSPKDEDTGS